MAFGGFDGINQTINDLWQDGINVGGVPIDLTPDDEVQGEVYELPYREPFPWLPLLGGAAILFLLLRR